MERTNSNYDIEALSEELELDLGSIAALFSSYCHEMEKEIAKLQDYLLKKAGIC